MRSYIYYWLAHNWAKFLRPSHCIRIWFTSFQDGRIVVEVILYDSLVCSWHVMRLGHIVCMITWGDLAKWCDWITWYVWSRDVSNYRVTVSRDVTKSCGIFGHVMQVVTWWLDHVMWLSHVVCLDVSVISCNFRRSCILVFHFVDDNVHYKSCYDYYNDFNYVLWFFNILSFLFVFAYKVCNTF